jgi:hypothetical protein
MGLTSLLTGPLGMVLKGGLGLAGGLVGDPPTNVNTNQNTQGSSETNTNSSGNSSFEQWLKNFLESQTQTQGATTSTSTTNPNLSPATQQLIDSLTRKYQQLTTPSLSGYAAQQTQGINRNADLQSQAVQSIMASRGLATSPVSGTSQANVEAGRFGEINKMQAGLPLLQNQLNTQNLGAAANFMQMIPPGGTTNTQDTNQTQRSDQSSGGQNFQNTWGYQGTNSSQNTTGTQTTQKPGGVGAGLLGLLGGLFSDVRLKEEIKPIDKALEKISALHPSTWKWKGTAFEDTGLLAQDIAEVLPELIDKSDGSGYLKVNYAGLIGTLVGAVQELQAEVKS